MDQAAAARYAQALFEAARNAKEEEAVGEDLSDLKSGWREAGLEAFLSNPRHPADLKQQAIATLEKKLRSKLSANFLRLILRKFRISLLNGVETYYRILLTESKGIVPCHVVLAEKPSSAFLKSIEKRLEKLAGSKVDIDVEVKPEVIGGISVAMKNHILDATFASNIQDLKQSLLKTKIN